MANGLGYSRTNAIVAAQRVAVADDEEPGFDGNFAIHIKFADGETTNPRFPAGVFLSNPLRQKIQPCATLFNPEPSYCGGMRVA
jgi:hypothetical protein